MLLSLGSLQLKQLTDDTKNGVGGFSNTTIKSRRGKCSPTRQTRDPYFVTPPFGLATNSV